MLWSCSKDDTPEKVIIPDATVVNKFVYHVMADWYLWVDNVPDLKNTKFQNNDSLNAYLNKFTDPEKLFDNLLYQPNTIDYWSFIVDDSKTIDDWLAGISETMGFNFGLGYINSKVDNKLFGVVRYVIKGSPADKAGIKRGDLFITVDGTQLTDANYQTLLYTKITYTLGLASFINSNFVSNGRNLTMTAVTLQENPILLDTVLNINGIKVGYLVYNSFNGTYDKILKSSYDIELNKVFGKFKTAGIQKLILDLRYNGGGAISSTIYLASMIYSTDTKKIFARSQHNNNLNTFFKTNFGDDFFIDYFTNTIDATAEMPATPINSLGLKDLYVIATSRTASASELLINGLKPYLTIHQVGSSTDGKYVGSYTLKDYYSGSYTFNDYISNMNKGLVNTTHKWAMQPITLKIANSQGVSDFVNGLQPDISATEYANQFLPFADQNEAMLKPCLDDIRGTKSAGISSGQVFREVKTPDELSPYYHLMYYDPEKMVRKMMLKHKAE